MELNEKKFKQLLNDMYAFRDKAKANGNSKYERISNKDILMYFISSLDKLNGRVTRVEVKQNILFWIIPPILGIMGVVGGILYG